ncbi:membrane lipoprotein lipid attachment site-containing protein [Sphingomonas sp. CARO-RG-8B-R24-01]|uniref:membrane lipoprotein lipid attachment site-containing protein n=1 Tax=Sphingomonas sp. CARO-RG-8B-R24-01 TaxID=2914831 RepID=UPI001F588E7E|nr:membrane lipoprotein lipid attachment site-containing protein [Sphingomonas sp. CARO-RG-8B-R24-01]
MKRLVIGFGALLVLSGCGASSALKPAEGQPLPVAPYGAKATPTPTQLLTPSNQARPERSDELLKNSQERRGDEFDLPPPN